MAKLELRKYRIFVFEFALIVAGVLAALAVDDWRQSRSDVATERFVLEGILGDLGSDIADLELVIRAANSRIAGASKLLGKDGVAAEQEIPSASWSLYGGGGRFVELVDSADREFPRSPITTRIALEMITTTGSMHVFNLSASAFTGSLASGDLNTVRDLELRSAISKYYYEASIASGTVDERVEGHWIRLKNEIAGRGLHTMIDLSGDEILNLLKDDTAAIAEIANSREFAVFQIINSSSVLENAAALADSVRAALATE